MAGKPLLEVDRLRVRFATDHGVLDAVDGISFTVGREKLGIVGESGSGKSMTGRAILKLTPPRAQVDANRLRFEEIDLLHAGEQQMLQVRGRRIAMILQDPKYSLNPVVPVGEQIAEAYRIHHKSGRREAAERALAMLEAVHIRDPARVFRLYPHEVSGGMGQRVMIAMMLIPEPDLLIADEPTSALDVSVQAQVLDIIDDLVRRTGMGLILISHDLNLVSSYCDRILVMRGGAVVEECAAGQLAKASHPYTRGLIAAIPRIDETREELPVLEREGLAT